MKLAACEFSGIILKVDVAARTLVGQLRLPKGAIPQDVRLPPDSSVFFIADMMSHGLYFSRDSQWL